MTILVRAATLTNFETVASACGLDARSLLAEVGLPSRCLSDPDLMVPAAAVGALLELAAERACEPAFGLRMAAARRLSNLGPLGLLLRDQPTLRQALEALATRIHMHNEAMTVSVVQDGPLVAIREEMVMEGLPSVRQSVELAMGTTFRVLGIFLGEGWRPRQVAFRHPAPTSTTWHRHVFGDVVVFGQAFNEIVCRAADLEAPNPGADPVMARYSQRLLERDPGANPSMTERVRRLIVLLLPRGHCRVESVAQHLGVDRRTVANHLSAEHTTFSALVDGMREDLLSRYLEDGARSLSEVALLLGFSELSAFSRWHRRRFGVAPRTRRRITPS
ncbi:AraC family transcriptional regulator [Variovorax sp. YR216]|uniref:AraC family transcriptional regulator n=1 Tax=Variovorax sp. YR216 TaxID=1882828 RepID=UPI00089B50EA|nr:AraC family transcriptional regulator [Variovorax sp. YR216]SEB19191.1 AraC-type DNA-binding protein [Variovorax sp. YR216]